MSKKDYQALARAIHEGYSFMLTNGSAEDVAEEARNIFTSRISKVLAADNPRFDHERFIEACETGTVGGPDGPELRARCLHSSPRLY
jgi:hypothetical protein